MNGDRVEIPGSELKPRNGERVLSEAGASQEITVTLLLRRSPKQKGPSEQDLFSGKYQPQNREAAEAAIAADPADIAAVRSFAEQYGLKILNEDPASRRVQVRASPTALEKAFGVQLKEAEGSSGNRYLTYSGAISVPKNLSGIVTAVLGLDQRPVAAPRAQ
jgi:kumamolisin